MAFRREKYVPRGGPSGGDGGEGGSVYLVGRANRNTLYHLRFASLYAADRGRHGEGSNRAGKDGEDFEVEVPLGTVVYDEETGEMLEDEWVNALILTDEHGIPIAPGAHPLLIALHERRPAHRTIWGQGPDGVRRHVEVTAFPLIGQGGRALGAVAIFWEVKHT